MKVWVVFDDDNEILEIFHQRYDALEFAKDYVTEKAEAWHYTPEELKEALADLEMIGSVEELVYIVPYIVR